MSFIRVVYVLWLRQLKRYFRSKPRMIGSLGQPLLFLLALGFGFGPIFQKAGGGDYLQFLTPGIISMGILFTSTFTGIEVIWDKQFGFLKETLVAPVSRFAIMFGRTLGGATIAMAQGGIILLLSMIFGFRPMSILMMLPAILVMGLVAIIFTALGTAMASRMEDMHGFQLIVNFLIMPIFFMSGALFPLEGLPSAVITITKLNPLAYGVDALRFFLIGTSHFGILLDLSVLMILSFVFMALGSYLFSKMEA
ncbi:multidrug ABC transporter permease [Candidatus Woesearchaeota archaeon CG11_big_fil_rev_8_21_14_0_20_43_8]|nr:MAG: multidrug ABC transporter permease [Candidatus Woesearchaeota archaeon CG11_big_fil_rev_8_21_14_0_20_43_8]PIO05605.1 MAG: multidrug ABC transporter permease [Candidatus Woesearchaeota archaeon CG08_land_8_20_14_0_20_43_7]